MSNLINSQNINLNESDNIYDEIYETSEKEFLSAFQLIETDPIELENKKALFYILLNDVTKLDIAQPIDLDPNDILNSLYTVIDKSIDDLEDKISNKNNSHIEEIKKLFLKKKESISKKLKDCDITLKMLKKAYLNKNIESYFGNVNTNSLNFKSVNVLYSNNTSLNHRLGEFFTRFIFNLIKKDETPGVVINYTQQDFYSSPRIESFVRVGGPPIFEDILDTIDNNFKYWVILLFLISQIFSEKPDYNKLFKKNLFEKFLREIEKDPPKKKTNSKKKKDKKKGGAKKKIKTSNKKLNSILIKDKQKKINLTKISSNKVVNPRNIFNEALKVFVNNGVKTDLENIYLNTFTIKLKDILLECISNPIGIPPSYGNPLNLGLECKYEDIKFINPFSKSGDVCLQQISKLTNEQMGNRKIKYNQLDSELRNIKWDIFKWLNFIIQKYLVETNDFITKIKSKLILLLFYLYNLKKSIYKYYIERLDNLFNLNNVIYNSSNPSNNGKSRRSSNSNSNSNNIVYNTNTIKVSKKKSDSHKNNNVLDANKEISKIQKKINSIKSKKADINNDEKILILEAKLKQLIIQRLNS
jgi:hypothetical protein